MVRYLERLSHLLFLSAYRVINTVNDMKKSRLYGMNLPADLKNLSVEECNEVCSEIRDILINTVSKTGGHLASNLGVVELTVALHRVFNSPDDKILWDVGHQAYTHKILTGRLDRFDTLRQENGISGFPKPSESEHDSFISGHSSTSISLACGMAKAMKLEGRNDNYAIAVIGDGAFTGGMAYEGLNNGGKSNTNLIIILNDNGMSISRNVGGFARYLRKKRVQKKYITTKIAVAETLEKIPFIGSHTVKAMRVIKKMFKGVIIDDSTMFEDLGFIYLGPVDGHNIADLEEVLQVAKAYKKPVIIHINTVKGKGYEPAEKNPGNYHGVSPFEVSTGNPEVSSENSYSAVFGRELLELGKSDRRICAVTAAMKYGTGLQYFANEIPERFFDVGIAEQYAVTFSAGMAKMGKIPVFAVYSSFLQRAYDQIIHDASIGGVHIVLGIDRAGIVGEDGETHQGLFDISMLTSIPDTVIYSPSCNEELKYCLKRAVYDETGIACVRYPRGSDKTSFVKKDIESDYRFTGKSDKNEIIIITYGRIYDYAESAYNILREDGIECTLLKLTKIFPVEESLIDEILKYKAVFFFEESEKNGSVSEYLSCKLIEKRYCGTFRAVCSEGFVKAASVESALSALGLDRDSMVNTIRKYAEDSYAS